MITIINWSTALSLLSRPNLLARNVRMTTPEINKKTNSYTSPSNTLLDEDSQDSSQNVMINTLDTLTLFGDKRLNISYIYKTMKNNNSLTFRILVILLHLQYHVLFFNISGLCVLTSTVYYTLA